MKTMLGYVILLVAAFILAACGETSADRIDTLTKLKILAVRAASPTLYPGEVTRIDVLVGAPGPTSMTTLVTAFAQDTASDFGKGRARFGSAGLTFNFAEGSTRPAPPVDVGVPLPRKGAPNFGSVYYQAPITPGVYTLGAFVREGVSTISPTDPEAANQVQAEMGAALKALKTMVVVPKGQAKNANPSIKRLVPVRRWREVNEQGQRDGEIDPAGFTLSPKQVLRLKPAFTDEKPERPSAVWWITGGKTNGNGRTDIDWEAPAAPGIETIVCLLLDREGGADWYFQDVAVGVDKLAPDVPEEGIEDSVLALSGGRMVWLQFPAAASAAALRKAVAKQPALVRATVALSGQARLGWYLTAPVWLEGVAVPSTAATVQQMVSLPRGGAEMFLRIDDVVK